MKKTLFVFLFSICVFSFAELLANLQNGFAKQNKEPKSISISVLTKEKADALFKKMSSNKKIPFQFSIEGCYARATGMALMAEDEKIFMGKIFAEGNLQAKIENSFFPLNKWGWHVATVVYIEDQNKKQTLNVFDPSLFDHPVSVEEWKKKILYETKDYKPSLTALYYGSRYQYNPRSHEENRTAWDLMDVDDAEQMMKFMRCRLDIADCPQEGNPTGNEQGEYQQHRQRTDQLQQFKDGAR